MGDFQLERKTKLSTYKKAELTTEQGKWKNFLYDHILPINQNEKNIITEIRSEFWSFFKLNNIKLHQYFHHLNSSQALCFNLFFKNVLLGDIFRHDIARLQGLFIVVLSI
jgi:hypothetical protein